MNYNKYVLLFVLLFLAIEVTAQSGCTDIQATNFDRMAIENDGSCSYPLTTLPLDFKCYVDDSQLDETSGIINHDNDYWTHVDNSDNSIYRIDTDSDSIFQEVTIVNASNQDWEDITTDDKFIYIGDVGNNGGSRTNLRFYKVSKSDIDSKTSVVTAEKIKFSYSDQVVFNINHGNYFDCEAFFALNDSIHMFTKGWANRWTKHYVLPAQAGVHVAQLVDSFNVDGLITSAAIQGDSLVVLLGLNYTNGNKSFIWALSGFNGTDFFSGNKRRFEIGNINTVGQVEAICFTETNKGFITNEGLSATPAQIREFDLNPYLPTVPVIPTSVSESSLSNGIHVYPNPFSFHTTFEYTVKNSAFVSLEIYNIAGEKIETIVDSQKQLPGNYSYLTGDFSPGIYFVKLTINSEPFIKRIVRVN